jgi:hypothetical protein
LVEGSSENWTLTATVMPITGMSEKLSPRGSFLTMWLFETQKEWFSSDQLQNKWSLAWFLVWGCFCCTC